MGCPALELAGHWVELGLSVEVEISGRALTDWYYMGPGGCLVIQCPELSSPTSEAQAWHPAGTPRPCQLHGFWEVWGLLPAFGRCSVGVVPHVDVILMYLWGGRWSAHLTPPPSWRSSPGHPCLVSDLRRNAFSFSLLTMMLAPGLSYVAFTLLIYVSSIPTFWRGFLS